MADLHSGNVPPEDEKALEDWPRPQNLEAEQEPILDHRTAGVDFYHDSYAPQFEYQGPNLPTNHSEPFSSLYKPVPAPRLVEHDFESIGSQYNGSESHDQTFYQQQPYGGEYQEPTEPRYSGSEYDNSFDFFGNPASAYPSTRELRGDVDHMEMPNVAEASTVQAAFERSVSNPDIMIDSVATLQAWNPGPPSVDYPPRNTTTDDFSPYGQGSESCPIFGTPASSRSAELLGVPSSSSQANPPSPTYSAVSTTPSSVPEELQCSHEGCNSIFTGKYRRGNLQRHTRLKHKEEKARLYPCGIDGCIKVYMRQDGLLKHQRNKHPSVCNR